VSTRAVRVVVTGVVQGVGFRWFVRERARVLNLEGWVRNRAGGAVELVVRGPDAAVSTLLEAVGQGPPGSRVARVVVDAAHDDERFPTPFTVHRNDEPE
jgi:acylphosphatase